VQSCVIPFSFQDFSPKYCKYSNALSPFFRKFYTGNNDIFAIFYAGKKRSRVSFPVSAVKKYPGADRAWYSLPLPFRDIIFEL
jgi:hypothetical protein